MNDEQYSTGGLFNGRISDLEEYNDTFQVEKQVKEGTLPKNILKSFLKSRKDIMGRIKTVKDNKNNQENIGNMGNTKIGMMIFKLVDTILWVFLTHICPSIVDIMKMFFWSEIRLSKVSGSLLMEYIRKNGYLLMPKEVIDDSEVRDVNNCRGIAYVDGLCMFIHTDVDNKRHQVISLTNQDSKKYRLEIELLRFQEKALKKLINKLNETLKKDKFMAFIYMVGPDEGVSFGYTNGYRELYITEDNYRKIDEEVKAVVEGRKTKTGIIGYGTPGNGKTSAAVHFASKYKLPIYSIDLKLFNSDLALLSAIKEIPGPSIISLEDFDSIIKDDEFTFSKSLTGSCSMSGLLNVLDGMYSCEERFIYFLTCNDLSKISNTLKNRPSRFQHVLKFENPGKAERAKIFEKIDSNEARSFGKDQLIVGDYNLSLDYLITIRNRYLEDGEVLDDIVKDIKKDIGKVSSDSKKIERLE
jgi:ATPases of the AAA+ class